MNRLSRLLEPDERDAVYGDLADSRMSPSRALREVAGLVVRRHAALWLGWRTWVALATVVVPLGFLLSVASRWFADGTAFNVSLYVRTGDWAYFALHSRHNIATVTTTTARKNGTMNSG